MTNRSAEVSAMIQQMEDLVEGLEKEELDTQDRGEMCGRLKDLAGALRPGRSPEPLSHQEMLRMEFHVHYEMAMLLSLRSMLDEELGLPASASELDRAKKRRWALLESFLIHCRNLREFFFYRKHRYVQDVIARDFLPEWQPPRMPEELGKLTSRVNTQVLHISRDRLKPKTPDEWKWNYGALADELTTIIRVFLAHAPKEVFRRPEYRRL